MKTPRQILLERHQKTQPKLDLIREQCLSAMTPGPDTRADSADIFSWIRSMRWHLVGLGTAWTMILALRLTGHASPATPVAQTPRSSPGQLAFALRENRRQLVELIEGAVVPSLAAPAADRRPRSEVQSPNQLA